MGFKPNLEIESDITEKPKLKPKKEKSIVSDGYFFKLEDKWKLVSHLHKSIRHGKVDEAKMAAKWIYMLDKNYARYRLAVICFEDVAGGDPKLINDIMSKGWKNEDIEKNGGVEWFSKVAGDMAGTTKNRFANDLCLCGLFLNDYLKIFNLENLEEQLISDAINIAWDENLNYFIRAIAVWRIVGTKSVPNSRLGKFEGDFNIWIENQKEHGVSEEIIECMKYGMKTQNEGSHLFLGFSEIERIKGSVLKENNYLDFGNIGPYCSSSIDKHTSEGKRAIYNYIKNTQSINSFDLNKEDLLNIIGKVQFRLEGGVLNKQVYFNVEKNIEEIYWKKFAKMNKLTQELYLNIKKTSELWHKYRVESVRYVKE